jgi:hypothetical protein
MVRAGHNFDRPLGAFDHHGNFSAEPPYNPAYRILDVWPMSVKRPEAHFSPDWDCLHWCQPGVQNWWERVSP